MDYLRIEEDGSLRAVKGVDPEQDTDLLQEVEQGTLSVVRYRGNQFEQLNVEETDEDEFDCSWEAIPNE